MHQTTLDKLVRRSFKLLPQVIHDGHKHFSFILDGKYILSTGINNIHKTHTAAFKCFDWPFLHSEVNSILNFSFPPKELRGLTMVNIRIGNKGKLRLSKPCSGCQMFLKPFQLDAIWYSVGDGGFECLWIGEKVENSGKAS